MIQTNPKVVGVFCTAVIMLLPVFVSAETAVRVSDSVSISDDQTVSGDFYGLADTLSLSGAISGDAYVVGGKLTTNGTIGADLFTISGVTEVHASVTDDVRIIGGDVTVAEYVGGDLFVLGGVLKVLSTATIEGNIFFYGGEAEINGSVGDSVIGTAEQIRIDGSVAGEVNVNVARSLVLGDRANIEGDVTYESTSDLVRAQNAIIVGDIVHNTPQLGTPDPRDVLVPFLIYAFSSLIIYALLRKQVHSIAHATSRSFVRNGLIGLGALFAFPMIIVLLLVTLIGLPLGLLSFFLFMSLLIISSLLVSAFVGIIAEKTFQKTTNLPLVWMIVGIVGTELLLLVPLIGGVVFLMCLAAVIGTLLYSVYRRLF